MLRKTKVRIFMMTRRRQQQKSTTQSYKGRKMSGNKCERQRREKKERKKNGKIHWEVYTKNLKKFKKMLLSKKKKLMRRTLNCSRSIVRIKLKGNVFSQCGRIKMNYDIIN